MQPTPRALALKGPVQRVLAAVKGEILDAGSFDPATETRPYTVATPDLGETLFLPRVGPRAPLRAAHPAFYERAVCGGQHRSNRHSSTGCCRVFLRPGQSPGA